MRRFWRLFYKAFPPKPPRGKGTKENPLEMDDLKPLFKALGRIGAAGIADTETPRA